MAKEMGVWGIDLGQCALKAIRLQEIDGQLTATAFDYVEHPKILSQPDADPDALTREALEKFLSRNSLRGDMVAISVPGQSGLARFVKLPPVEEKKINDIVRFEAKQQIPFNLEEVVWDYQKIGSGIVTDGFAMETEIGLFAMKRDMIGKYLQHFKDVKVEVHIVQMAPLSLCNFVAYDLLNKGAPGEDPEGEEGGKTKNCVVALDIGADSSNLIITDAERIIWQRPIPLGGNHFTRALTKDLKLTFAKAEHLKRNATKSPDLKKILASLKPVLNDFVGEVQRSLGYFTNTHRDAHVEYMVGLGNAFRLPGLQRFLAEKLQLDVRKLGKLERLSGEVLNSPTYTENILSFAVAYGLAVQGLKHSRLVTNLLPGEIRIERMVRAKKPWAVTAAACLLFSSGVMALDTYMEYRSYGDKQVVEAEDKSKKATDAVNAAEAAFNNAKAEADAEERAVRAIVAGQAEQRNWLKITKLIGGLTPQPDGVNFPPEYKKQYWTALAQRHGEEGGNTGQHAYGEYKKRLEGLASGVSETGASVGSENDDLSRGVDDLIFFNVESVDCRYTSDLSGTWNNIRNGMEERDRVNVRPAGDFDAPPAGNGWVFELKGYTYHHKKVSFVRDGLLENIARVGAPTPAAADPAAPAAAPGAAPPATATAAAPAPAAATPATAAPAPSPAAGAKPAAPAAAAVKDLKTLEAACKEPFKISHVVLFKTTSYPVTGYGSASGTLGSVLDGVLASASGSGSGGAPGAAPAAPVGGRPGSPVVGAGGGSGGASSTWTSLLGSTGAATGQTSGASGNDAGSSGIGRGPASRRRGPVGLEAPTGFSGSSSGGASAPAAITLGEGQHTRTDFVILFLWQEPTPSDVLRQLGTASPGKK
jgi:type IV pilus assembly protein PilM